MYPELIALDLDGTSVIYEPHLAIAPELVRMLDHLSTKGVRWCINSDRLYSTQIKLAQLLPPSVQPTAICSIQRYIHWRTDTADYVPDVAINADADTVHATLWEHMQRHFECWMQGIFADFPVVQHVADEYVLAVMTEPDHITRLRAHMQRLIDPFPDAFVSGNLTWAFVVHRDFSKGRVLRQASNALNVPRERVLAIGDGFNDIPMLNGQHAAFCGCPSNAEPAVKEAVRHAGGIISQAEGPAGTVDILARIFNLPSRLQA